LLADLTGGHIHLQHVSTAYGVDAIRRAKTRGVRVTAEATPHHLILTDERVEGFDTDAKLNPPLRSSVDREAVREGLADGTLDVFVTDHAPHHYDEKEQAFADAPNGIIGLETALGLGLTHLVAEGLIDLPTLIQRMSVGPAEAFGLSGGTLAPGSPGDVTIIDPEEAWTVDREGFLSKSRNMPFHGWDLKGRARYTIVGGVVVWEADRE
jgi:dihydroorotase